MMKTGIDIVSPQRIQNAICESFIRNVLSSDEFDKYCLLSVGDKINFLAGRFAVKEAIIKCLSGFEYPLMSELNIVNDEYGAPKVQYKGYSIALSISHERDCSVAIAILEL